MDSVMSFLGRSGYLPHGYCFTWSPALLWTMVTSDAVIALAYFSIPVAIVRFVRGRAESSLSWLAMLFSAFIFACGTTHVMDIWTIWQADYGLQAISKAGTAAISIATAIMLWPLIPKALKIPSVSQLQTVIASLEAEVQKRRSAEDLLADAQHSLALTLASIGAGFIATDRAGCVTRMNAVAEHVTGWTQAQALGHSVWQVFAREGREPGIEASNPVDVVVERGITVDSIQRVVAVARDGRRTAVEVRADLTRADDGQGRGQVRGLVMIFRDITRLARAEAEAAELAAIVASSHDPIIGKTLDGRITSWNQAAEMLFGYSAQQAIGQPVQMLIPPERAPEEMRILAQLARGEKVPAFDTVRRTRDGRLIDVSITVSPIRDGQGHITGASKIVRDVSHKRLAESARLTAERLEAENRQIQEASRLKSQFLANMSHELRTPLNAIIGFADLLHAGAVPPQSPKHRDFLGHIGTSGRHLLQLINDVLDLSKVESGKFEFFPEPVDLRRLAAEVSDVLHTALQAKQLVLTVELSPALGALVIDAARLKQALYNYLSNAIKFTPPGGQVAVWAAPEGPADFRLEVRDTGIGIAPADMPRLFVEFQQLDAGYSKSQPGTGLGLALTKRLVQAQGGSVGVRSTPGLGSVFHLVLPRVHAPAPPADAQAPVQQAQPPAPAAPEPQAPGAPVQRMLVIEDSGPLQMQLVQGLEHAGFEVATAATGQQALTQAAACGYDAITLGLRLPDQGGLGVLAGIREQGPSRSSPVVGMTIAAPAGGSAAFAISDVLAKPIRTDEVVAAMAGLRLRGPQRPRVLVVDDDPLALDVMQATLGALGIDAVVLPGGRQALDQIDQLQPDAIVLDLMMPVLDGFATLGALRRLPRWRDTPVFIWTSLILTDDEYASLGRSASAILDKGGGELTALLNALRQRPPARAAAMARGGAAP